MTFLGIIIAYLVALTALSFVKASKVKSQADFAVAGRSLSPWVLVASMLATWIGTGSILGNAGEAYRVGLNTWIVVIGGTLGIVILVQIAGKVRSYETFTVPEIIGARYGQAARALAVVALTIAYMIIVSYQFNAGGAVLHTIMQGPNGEDRLSVEMGTLIAAVFIVLFTLLAGMISVAYTSVPIGALMLIALFIAFPVLWRMAGGWEGMAAKFAEQGRPDHMKAWGVYSWIQVVNIALPAFLLVLGDANMYQRFSSSKDVQGAKQATFFLIFAVFVVELLIVLCAWVASSLIPNAANGRHVLVYAAAWLLPTWIGIIMMLNIVGIIISTAMSFLLSSSTSLIRDVYQNFIYPRASERHLVIASRTLVLLLGIVGFALSLAMMDRTFLSRALYAYTIYGAAVTPPLVAALFWRGATRQGAIASILGGTIMALAWKWIKVAFPNMHPTIMDMDEVLPAITVSCLLLIGVSLMTSRSATAMLEAAPTDRR